MEPGSPNWINYLSRGGQNRRNGYLCSQEKQQPHLWDNAGVVCSSSCLKRGIQEDEMPDEVNIDDLLEMDTDEERAKKLQGTLESCHNNTEDFTRELLEKLRGLRTEHVLRRTSPSSQRSMDQGPKVPQ
ncbi:protein phosphatase 1 regulatory subunit 14A isoform X3 [Pantherophis guttatus]|uniref:Protein phosphatase 1 regulatory subunit 14A isoform X3 n=1 Tax=Pantherophis guttatus TaxID=94885 RepID=A0A6P9DD54_PANGU|nr:protein phosphatase 1 regulatory subunit 14A isoform X3 [Pantherophis guttatus]